MDISKISVGEDPPFDLNVIIEVPQGGDPVKYEHDKASGALMVDRILHTPMRYPCNYGYLPHTLAEDGDPVDVMVVGLYPVMPGSVFRARPVGVLLMEDDGGKDEKILAVPHTRIWPYYRNVHAPSDLPEIITKQIWHFFDHYKDLEDNKWTKVIDWADAPKAHQLILEGIERQATD